MAFLRPLLQDEVRRRFVFCNACGLWPECATTGGPIVGGGASPWGKVPQVAKESQDWELPGLPKLLSCEGLQFRNTLKPTNWMTLQGVDV